MGLYQNYLDRAPASWSVRSLERWHERLLQAALNSIKLQSRPLSLLEIGPGHGYFAKVCREHGIKYTFSDISEPIFNEMARKGFQGYCKPLSSLKDSSERYDIIWMSHVLEHAPTWVIAREMLSDAGELLDQNGLLAVISPDFLSWKREFFNGDATHGYPTTLRNCVQLMQDVGLSDIDARYHRGAFFSIPFRAIFALVNLCPHRLIDWLISANRAKTGNGFVYSWKTIYGWRQIFVVAHKPLHNEYVSAEMAPTAI